MGSEKVINFTIFINKKKCIFILYHTLHVSFNQLYINFISMNKLLNALKECRIKRMQNQKNGFKLKFA